MPSSRSHQFFIILLGLLLLFSAPLTRATDADYDSDGGSSGSTSSTPSASAGSGSASSTVPEGSGMEVAPMKEGHAVMYILRPRNRMGSLRKAFFTYQGVDVAKVKNGRYTWIYVPQGVQRFKVGWMREGRWSNRNNTFSLNFVPGNTYYILFNTSGSSMSGRMMYFRYRLQRITPRYAASLAKRLTFQRTVKVKKRKKRKKKVDDSFDDDS